MTTMKLESVSDAALALIALDGYRERDYLIASGHFPKRPVSERLDASERAERLRGLDEFWQRTWGDGGEA